MEDRSNYLDNNKKSIGMSCDRFMAILSDNERPTRIWSTIQDTASAENFIEKFQIIYLPDEFLTIDEAICAFRGCTHFQVYMKGKPHKYGIKIFELC
jgi:hypothetical protein